MNSTKNLGLYLTSTGFGGLEMNAVNLGKWMKELGWEVHFFTIQNSRLYKEVIEAKLEVHLVERPNKYIDIKNALRLGNFLQNLKIQNLIIFDNHDLSTANYCKQFFKRNLKMIYLQQMQFKVKKTSPVHTFRFSGLNYWISPLESLKQQVLKTTKIRESKIVVIPLCLETNRYLNNSYSQEQALNKLNLKTDKKYIGVLGRIAPTKGQIEVIKAFYKINRQHPNVELLIMGEPTINEAECVQYDLDCKEFVKKHGLNERVHFLPFNKEVELFYSAIDIFIMASKKETFGMVTIEAMLSGKPVIGTNSGGTPELLNFGDYGQLFHFGNEKELIEKIENILLKKYNYQDAVQKAKNNARMVYDKHTMCRSLEALLK